MQTFLLPYIVSGQPVERLFAKVTAANISAAAAGTEERLRKHWQEKTGKNVCVAVAEVDYTYKNQETGEDLPRPAQAPVQQPVRRRRRRFW